MKYKLLTIFLFIQILTTSCSEKGQQEVKTMKPQKVRDFAPGPKLKPAKGLLSWLEKVPKNVHIRLPIVIRFKDTTWMERKDAFIAENLSELGEDSIFVKLDDTTMGIPLSDHLRKHKKGEETELAIWIEGRWGTALELPMIETENSRKGHPFTVRRVLEPIKDEILGTAFIEKM